jgi:hypothetical protein
MWNEVVVVQSELPSQNITGGTEENHKLSNQVVDFRAEIWKGTSGTSSINDNHSTTNFDGTESLGA